ncbi:MAG: hypothetical protein M9953_00445 [Thermomicrobiales bacterium]|nr:hypothetical protein [Thermomicrobiales bacterium]MCO5223791.1 hypothetical protein [Thermomicrobiales bacterium]
MTIGSTHRAIIGRKLVVADGTGVVEIDGHSESRWLRTSVVHAEFTDPVIADLSARFPQLRPLTDGGLWEGLFSAITAQAVSLISAAAFQRRLCLAFSPPITSHGREFHDFPQPEAIAEASVEMIKSAGLTTKRAEGLKIVATEVARGNVILPTVGDEHHWSMELQKMPMVGKWTSASVLLWGLGHEDVYPSGDVALLRAAKLAYNDASMTMRDLDKLSEQWRPQRAIAARLLWTALLGCGWDEE